MDGGKQSLRLTSVLPLPETLWLATLVAAFTGLDYLNAGIAAVASFWIYWRVKEVIRTPVPQLIKRLGLELPTAPTVSLLEITSSSVSLHWKGALTRYSVARYVVKLNGQCVGDVSNNETAISIDGLRPATCYSIRIIAVNSYNFRASSECLNVRTRPGTRSAESSLAGDGDSSEHSSPPMCSIVPIKAFLDSQLPHGIAPLMTREHSSTHLPSRRNTNQRKSSGTSSQFDHRASVSASSGGTSDSEPSDQVPALTVALDNLRREINELDTGDKDEEQEFQREKEVLEEKLENLKVRQREREAESKELRKRVTHLEREVSNSQAKAKNQERLLQSKRAEREKLNEDTRRWAQQIKAWEDQEIQSQETRGLYERNTTEKVDRLKRDGESVAEAARELEQQARELRKALKQLEDQKNDIISRTSETDFSYMNGMNADPDEIDFHKRMMDLQTKLNTSQASYHHVITAYQHLLQRFSTLSQARRGSQVNAYQHSMGETPTNAIGEQIPAYVNATPKSQAPFLNYPAVGRSSPSTFAGSSVHDGSLTQRSESPWYTSNGTSRTFSDHEETHITPYDYEKLSAGGLVSPGASGLLPQGLLGDDNEDSPLRSGFFHNDLRPSPLGSDRLASLNTVTERNRDSMGDGKILPGLGDVRGLPGTNSFNVNTASPTLPTSRSPSLVSSPHGSIANLHQQKLSETSMDSDRRSIKSASSMSRTGHSRRFGTLFGGRARGKTTSDDLPALGSLDSKQTQSLPRADSDPVDAVSAETHSKKFRESHGLFGQVSTSLLGRRHPAIRAVQVDSEPERASEGPVNSFNFFGARPSIWSQSVPLESSSLSRPTSTYSADPQHPRTVGSDLLGWSGDATGHVARNPWSSQPSRRQSIQHDTSPIAKEFEHEAGDDDYENGVVPTQAPIGTKPSKTRNKASRASISGSESFMQKFRSDKKLDNKSKKRAKDEPNADDVATPVEDTFLSRMKSRSDQASHADSTESASFQDGDDVETPSIEDVQTPSSANRESFMAKLTRKSSSNRFSMQGLKFSRKTTAPGHPAEETDEEASMLGKSIESIANASPAGQEREAKDGKRSSAFSLSSLKRKKKGTDAPSISETSMTSASATGDDEEGSGRPSADDGGVQT